ncbi:hypothetical protein [Campylobacter devanensis]|uniref:hypothetical protein n=1 Tax=Campylobacter devanensis TaxID=3161138 RepID=UPI0015D74877|nr:hypothetical protein [Campylobacter sp. P0107]
MDFFFIEYRDPIFGLIVLFAAVLLVAISSYALGIWGVKDENRSIEKFVKKFENSSGLSQNHYKKNAKVKTYETYFINPLPNFIL